VARHAELHADTIVLISFLQELLRLIDDPRQMSISPPRS
jgi:hypothetical protein